MEETVRCEPDIVAQNGEEYIPDISLNAWLELIQNDEIFLESDLVYLKKMVELGGEASATQLAAALDRHYSSFNMPVVQLAKRVLEVTDIQPNLRDNGKIIFWNVLFEGEYDNQFFVWKLKPNLKAALEIFIEEKIEIELPIYLKEDFLREVFIDR